MERRPYDVREIRNPGRGREMRAVVLAATVAVAAAAGCDAPPAKVATEPEKRAGAPRAKPEAPRKTAAAPTNGAAAPKAWAFDEALREAEERAKGFAKEFEAELPAKRKLLAPAELNRLDEILSREAPSPDHFAESEMEFMRSRRMAKWIWGRAARWAAADPAFVSAARRVWARSPKDRAPDELLELAIRWVQLDVRTRSLMAPALASVESGAFTERERDVVTAFAGEGFFPPR
jgi:hypothetical protein